MRDRLLVDEDRRPLAEAAALASRVHELTELMVAPLVFPSPKAQARRDAFLASQGVTR